MRGCNLIKLIPGRDVSIHLTGKIDEDCARHFHHFLKQSNFTIFDFQQLQNVLVELKPNKPFAKHTINFVVGGWQRNPIECSLTTVCGAPTNRLPLISLRLGRYKSNVNPKVVFDKDGAVPLEQQERAFCRTRNFRILCHIGI